MGYSDVALLANDFQFSERITAAYATETVATADSVNAQIWARDHAWQMAAQPGFGDKYASALASRVALPGNDPSVISDADILSGVQSILAIESGV